MTSLTDVIVSHFDPLRHFDTKTLDQIRRRELFVRIQSTAQQPTPSYLDPKVVKDIEKFLHTLGFLEQR